MSTWRDDALQHALRDAPREACGLVVVRKGREVYRPCRNLAVQTDQFVLCPDDYEAAEAEGEVTAVVHSHPNVSPLPSQADQVSCEATGLEWHIVNVPTGAWHSFKPTGYTAPLVGRVFSHGVLDCYAIIRDWYKQERSIDLLDFDRHDGWWSRGGNLARGAWIDLGRASGVKPLLMVISAPRYRRRIVIEEVVRKTVAREFDVQFAQAYQRALATAR